MNPNENVRKQELIDTLKELYDAVRLARLEEQEAEDNYKALKEYHAKMLEPAKNTYLEMAEHCSKLEETLRIVAAEALADGIALPGGLKVRERKEMMYEHADAFAWCREHGLFLVMDQKAFEKFAAMNELPFVAIAKMKQVTIPVEMKELEGGL